VQIKNAQMAKSLLPKHIIKSIAQMNAAELPQIEESWKSIMRRKQLGVGQKDHALNVIPG
jgi:hypothetical protein